MEAQITETATPRRHARQRLLASGVLALALLGAAVGIASANDGHAGVGNDITITAISGSQLTLTSADGWTRTIDASNASVLNGTTAITVADLKVGDQVTVDESQNFDGSETVTSITVVAPTVEGIVTAVDTSTLTVRETDGTMKTVTLDASTTYSVNGAAATQSAISVGSDVTAQGTTASDGTFTATAVAAHPASVSGTVTATTADAITISDASGATMTVNVGAATTYRTSSGAGGLADVTTGSVIRAQGAYNADGTFSATSVSVGVDMASLGDGQAGPNGGPNGGFPGGPNRGGRGNGFGHQPGMPMSPGSPSAPTTPTTPASPSPSVSPSASPSA